MTQPNDLDFDSLEWKLSRDLRGAAAELGEEEVRFLVSTYYQLQNVRIASGLRRRTLVRDAKPHALVSWFETRTKALEGQIRAAMLVYARSRPLGLWALSIHGIGPVIAAGLIAHIDFNRTTSVSKLWRFAGLDPTVEWKKGAKRPWNAELKRLCFLTGQSFMKHRNSPKDNYGKVYEARKLLEIQRNERGDFAELAQRTLEAKKIRHPETRATYESGQLPAGRIELRAERYATKLFLSHFWVVGWETHTGQKAPDPWVIAHGGHTDRIPVPNYESPY